MTDIEPSAAIVASVCTDAIENDLPVDALAELGAKPTTIRAIAAQASRARIGRVPVSCRVVLSRSTMPSVVVAFTLAPKACPPAPLT